MKLEEQLAELDGGPVTPDIVRRWAATERARCAEQWPPLRKVHASDGDDGDGAASASLVQFWDVEEGTFSVGENECRVTPSTWFVPFVRSCWPQARCELLSDAPLIIEQR